jgi:K+ transporter
LYALVRRYGKWVYMPAIIGAATLLADGIIHPADLHQRGGGRGLAA